MDEKNDRHLIEACIKKDLVAWSGLVKKYSGLISLSIENRIKKYGIPISGHDIEDIRQDLFANIWKDNKLIGVQNRDDISHWIAIISGNAAIEHFRKKESVKMRRTVSLSDKIDDRELHELLPSGSTKANDDLSRAELSDNIDKVIESLPPKENIIIKLHLNHGKKHSEIADILNIPEGTVSSCVKRAKEKMREKLKKYLQEF